MKVLNCKGTPLDLRQPVVMGIVNTTDDSFYAGSRVNDSTQLLDIVRSMIKDGAHIVDIGGLSTRPGSSPVSAKKEKERVSEAVDLIKQNFPDILISVDTYRSEVARSAVESGASIINDISAFRYDAELPYVALENKCPYVLMHMQGDPENMQNQPVYEDVITEVFDFLAFKNDELRQIGLHDVIIDVGFGFGKTIEHNYKLLNHLRLFKYLEKPLLAGLSRKGMLWRPLQSSPDDVLPATITANLLALQQGASILRVHDVGPAIQLIKTIGLAQINA